MERKKIVVIGGKWFDKVNGNTYNSAKIIDTETGRAYYTPFCYGYGSAYLHEAENYIKEELKQSNAQIIDGGSFYVMKLSIIVGKFFTRVLVSMQHCLVHHNTSFALRRGDIPHLQSRCACYSSN